MYKKWSIFILLFLLPGMNYGMSEREVAGLLVNLGSQPAFIPSNPAPQILNQPVQNAEPEWKKALTVGIANVLTNKKIVADFTRRKHFSELIKTHIQKCGYEHLDVPVYDDAILGTFTVNRIIKDYKFIKIKENAHREYLKNKDAKVESIVDKNGESKYAVVEKIEKRARSESSVGSSPTKKIQLVVRQGNMIPRRLDFAGGAMPENKSEVTLQENALKAIYSNQMYKNGSYIKATVNGKFMTAIGEWIDTYKIENVSNIRLMHRKKEISLSEFIVMADDKKLFEELIRIEKLIVTEDIQKEINQHPSNDIYKYWQSNKDRILAKQVK